MKRPAILLTPLLVLALLLGSTGCGEAGDAGEVVELIGRQVTAFNERDWPAAYETMSPSYRATCSYQEFRDFSEGASALFIMAFGEGKFEATDIHVSVKGEWAYATLTLLCNDRVVAELTSTEPDIWRKVAGTWYDVTEDPMDPGYNADDLPEDSVVGYLHPTAKSTLYDNRAL